RRRQQVRVGQEIDFAACATPAWIGFTGKVVPRGGLPRVNQLNALTKSGIVNLPLIVMLSSASVPPPEPSLPPTIRCPLCAKHGEFSASTLASRRCTPDSLAMRTRCLRMSEAGDRLL